MRKLFNGHKYWLSMMLICLLVLLVTGCGAKNNGADSAKYPNQPIKMIVTHGVGGGVDTSARGIQSHMEKVLGTPVVVENKTGAGGLVALNFLATQKPDGYTILVGSVPSTMLKQFLSPNDAKFEYNEFVPLGAWNNEDTSPFLVSGKSPYKTWEEFKEGMKDKKIKLGISGGMGSSDHVAWVLLKEATGLDFVAMPFDSAAEAMTQLQGGHVDAALASVSSAAVPVKDGTLKVLAVPSGKRVSVWPDVPTFQEVGYKDVWLEFHVGAFAPKGTPEEVKKTLSDAIVTAASTSEFKEWANKAGIPVGDPIGSDGWQAYINEEYARMKILVEKLLASPLG